jgi:large subunit ribosomal protein L14
MERKTCIQVLRTNNQKYADIGDVIIVVIKEAISNMPLKKSKVVRVLVKNSNVKME